MFWVGLLVVALIGALRAVYEIKYRPEVFEKVVKWLND